MAGDCHYTLTARFDNGRTLRDEFGYVTGGAPRSQHYNVNEGAVSYVRRGGGMTDMTKTKWPWFAVGLIAFQAVIQAVARGIDGLRGLELPTSASPETFQSIRMAGLAVTAAVAVAGSAWLGRKSRRQGEDFGWLAWVLVGLAVCIMLATAVMDRVMSGLWDYNRYPASLIIWIYAEKALEGFIWCSAAAAIRLRLWVVIALAFHAEIAMRYAEAVSVADASQAVYAWDRNPQALTALLSQGSVVSLAVVLFIGALATRQLLRRKAPRSTA